MVSASQGLDMGFCYPLLKGNQKQEPKEKADVE